MCKNKDQSQETKFLNPHVISSYLAAQWYTSKIGKEHSPGPDQEKWSYMTAQVPSFQWKVWICVCVHAYVVCMSGCMCAYCDYKQLQKNAIPQLLAPITWFPSKVTWFSYNWSTVRPGSSLWKYSLYWQQCWLFAFQLFVQLFLIGWNMVKECRKSLENWENSAT